MYKKVTDILVLENKNFYTYTPRSLKPKSIILKGVNSGFSADMIKEELESLNIENVKSPKTQ